MPGTKPKATTLGLLDDIRRGDFTASENLEEKLEVVGKRETEVNAFIELFIAEAREKAREIDSRIASGKKVGRLAGLVLAVKNNIAIRGRKLTCGSRMLENYSAMYNAAVVENALAEDAVVIGSTNMDEFACGSDTTSSAIKQTRNPLDLQRVPGGSSGGSAAAVAYGACDLALASDTGGSIRCPASFCGVTGFKPSYGLVSRYGLVDMAMSLDQVGPIANDVRGAAALLGVIAGEDGRDTTTAGTSSKEFEGLLGKPGELLTVGVPKQFFAGCDASVEKVVRNALDKLRGAGHEVVELNVPALEYALPVYYILMYAEFSSGMQRYDGFKYGAPYKEGLDLIEAVSEARARALGREVKRRILLGTYVTTKEFREAWYTKTLKARSLFKSELEKALREVDLIVGPTMPSLPWKVGEKAKPLEMYLADVLTVPANIAGLPAGTVNAGFAGSLPVGLQMMGSWGRDEVVLRAMREAERLM